MASGLALSVFAPQIHLVPLFVANATSSTSRGKSIKGRGKKCCGKALGSPFGRAGALAPERVSTVKIKSKHMFIVTRFVLQGNTFRGVQGGQSSVCHQESQLCRLARRVSRTFIRRSLVLSLPGGQKAISSLWCTTRIG